MARKLRVLDLFSGIGGFSLGLERALADGPHSGFETAAFCEIEDFPRRVLAKHWPDVPCYADVRELTAERLCADAIGPIDLICGGYPCQPFSTAGKRAGDKDDRHLWPEVFRLIGELQPDWFVGENVAGHVSLGLDQVLSDLESAGYSARPFIIPACSVDAPHRRDRVWIVGHSNKNREPDGAINDETSELCKMARFNANRKIINGDERKQSEHNRPQQIQQQARGIRSILANPPSQRQSGSRQPVIGRSPEAQGQGQANQLEPICQPRFWPIEPPVGRVANGVPSRMDRLKCLGNAVVPQIPEIIGQAILDTLNYAPTPTRLSAKGD